jgi:hypothetical protein
MAKLFGTSNNIDHKPKGTSIGRGKFKKSSMNKSKRRSYKKYRGQGKG